MIMASTPVTKQLLTELKELKEYTQFNIDITIFFSFVGEVVAVGVRGGGGGGGGGGKEEGKFPLCPFNKTLVQ